VKSFEYAAPKKLKEAIELLSRQWGETEIMAGGTDLVTSLKQGLTKPKRVVSLRNVPNLGKISSNRKGITIGAMKSLQSLLDHAGMNEHFPAVITAVKNISSPQMLAMGTLGGELCQRPRCWYFRNGYGLLAEQNGESLVVKGDNRYHAIFGNEGKAKYVHPSSLAPALIALGASVMVAGPQGKEREIPLADFFRTPAEDSQRETALMPNEILTQIHIPKKGLKNATYEVRHRHGLDWPYVTASVAFASNKGVASGATVVLGQVAPVPWEASQAALTLEGATVDELLAVKCGNAAAQGANPLSGNDYKVQLVKTATKRAVRGAAA
jgi:xanthine dehydrogenase YagS FAD-binding subunit